jgi:3-hydroxyisobutyrate dehydrogenase-like beta-hydroxyacid dehydrogenase
MSNSIAFIGFGEAGQAFAWPGARAFDAKTGSPVTRTAMLGAYASTGVEGSLEASTALVGAGTVLVVVTADQALAAARDYAPLLGPGALWLDMNSVAPGTKRAAAVVIEAAGGRYVDVAIMAPVLPVGRGVPLLVSGPHAEAASAILNEIGFRQVATAGSRVGQASAIKMIRSVMVKGIEAVAAEMCLAANRAGVSDAILASLEASRSDRPWADGVDYNLNRMLAHGLRRAAEMEEAAKTLEDLGIDPVMTRGTVFRQRELGALGIDPPPGLAAKLAAIDPDRLAVARKEPAA